MIELVNLGKTYESASGQVVALKNINLTVNDGDIYGIIGLSGAGKSTLVRCINLLEKPTEGDVLIDGINITQLPNKELRKTRRNIGMIFQNFNLLEQRTVLNNVTFPLELLKISKEERIKKARELLDIVGLKDKEKAYPSQLSGGQKQRVAIARALASNPKYLLCDEATSALDPETTIQILELLREINKKLKVTIIIITHEMRVVESICNKVAVINKSVIEEEGSVVNVFATPKSEIAKRLVTPDLIRKQGDNGVCKLRCFFGGEIIDTPVISGLAMELRVPVNIIYADTKQVDGKIFGCMVITLPNDELSVNKTKTYLTAHNVKFSEEL